MANVNQNSPDVLSEEILAEAKRECDEILRLARQESESLLAAATAEADKIRRDKLEAARTEAARRTELMLATIPVEAGRLRSARIETILENIHEEARHELLARDFDGHETVVTLAAEAVRRMPGTDFVLKISAADHAAFGDKLAGEIAHRSGTGILPVQSEREAEANWTGWKPVPLHILASPDVTVTDGVVIQSADGLRIWDNRLLSRLERLWPELRRQIATQTSLLAPGETSKSSMISESQIVAEEHTDARQRPGVRQPSGAFTLTAKAAEGCRSPKPGGNSDAPRKGAT
jgi:vacuolar-type H+-ATPase subunit E/Vma4